ncbi:hypothetical protein [Lactococcus lactis]|uniref:hypothetical protein n=1 Tax=Lactococcus lactis TaxID=1358 RepID=UPI00240F061D|nr:hypothetical protein [Lactococcus lactis]
MNQDKYKTAQQAISKLTSSYSKGLKDSLNKQLATSKKQADDATKTKQAKSASDSKAKTADTNKQQSGSTEDTNDNGSNGGNNNNNQPQTRYVGWVSVDGVRRYSHSVNTLGEAQSYVDATVNSAEVINLGFEHSIRYGVEPA